MSLKNPGSGNANFVLSLSMLLVFLGLGFSFVGTDFMIDRFPKPNRIYIGLVLFAWAIFRGAMLWFRFKKMKNEENED